VWGKLRMSTRVRGVTRCAIASTCGANSRVSSNG